MDVRGFDSTGDAAKVRHGHRRLGRPAPQRTRAQGLTLDQHEEGTMRGRGITYDTGFFPGGETSREAFDSDVVRRELQVVAEDLHCTAVRITGGDPERLSLAAGHAAESGLEVWFSPFPCEMTPDQMLPYFADCAERAEDLRHQGARIVLVTGCELSLFAAGFIPGENAYARIAAVTSGDPELWASLSELPARVNAFLAEAAATAHKRFGGKVTYASMLEEDIDWSPFDIVAVDAYRDAHNASGYRDELRRCFAFGKPVAVTEFGCSTFRGAADDGGLGWAIVDEQADPPRLTGRYVRDEAEQVGYLHDLLGVFEQEGVDSAFWFTFADYNLPHDPNPSRDLDMASYGVVKVLANGHGATYPDMRWEPKASFYALAAAYADPTSGRERGVR